MSEPRLVEIACQLKHETKAAFLVHDGDQDVWVPKSLGEWHVEKKDMGIMILPEWFAQKAGLI